MFNIYIKNFNRNGSLVQTETLIQTIPAASEGGLRLISPQIKNEMGNAESFDFSIEPGTPFYDAFLQMKTMIRVEYDGDNIFYGRVLTVENNRFSGARKVRCEGAISLLMDSPVKGVKEASRSKVSTYTYMSGLISSHNDYIGDPDKRFILGQVPGNYSGVNSDQKLDEDTRKFGSDSWSDTKSALEDLRSHFGGYFRTRTSRIGNGIYLDWLDNYFSTTTNAQTIEVSKNILDISDITEVDNIFTVLVPLGTYQNTSNSSDSSSSSSSSSTTDNTMYIDGTYLPVHDILNEFSYSELNRGYHKYEDYANAIRRYGAIFKTVQFSNATSKSDLREKACEWIKDNYYGEVVKYTIKAIDMRQIGQNTSKIMVGDLVRIVYPVIKEDGTDTRESKVRTCMSINYDLYHPENNSYTFGIPANILTSMYGISNTSSVSSNSTSAGGNGGEAEDEEGTPWGKISNWLMNHRMYYDWEQWGSDYFPWTTEFYGDDLDHMHGPAGYSDKEYMFNPGQYIYRFTYSIDSGYDARLYKQILSQDGMLSALSYKSAHCHWSYAKDTSIRYIEESNYIDILNDYNIREYVMMEYGFDLLAWAEVSGLVAMGNTIVSAVIQGFTDTAGNTIKRVAFGSSILTGMIGDSENNPFTKLFTFLDDPFEFDQQPVAAVTNTANSIGIKFSNAMIDFFANLNDQQPSSWVDKDGTLHWYYEDPKSPGTYVETTNRSLNLMAVNDDNFIGTMVTQDYADADGNIHIYKFGQGIEDWAGGKMVVANVDGDVIKIGSESTNWATTVARKINGTFLDPITFVVNNSDPSKPDTILVGTAGQVSYKARYDETLGAYVYDENGDVTLTGDGFWNTKNLAIEGGVYTVRENNRYVSYVKSSQLIIGDQNTSTTVLEALLDSGVIDSSDYEPQALVTNAVYTQNLYADRARISTIEADYITVNNINAKFARMSGGLNTPNITGISNNSTCNFDVFNSTGNKFLLNFGAGTLGPSPSNRNLADGIYALRLTQSGNTYSLRSYSYLQNIEDTTGGTLVGTFSRAITSFSGTWDGNKLTVNAQPQNQNWIKMFERDAEESRFTSNVNYRVRFKTYTPPTSGGIVYDTNCQLYGDVAISSITSAITADSFNSTFNTKTSIPVRIYGSGQSSAIKTTTFDLVNTTYTIGSSGTTNHCVNLVSNNTIYGRINIESVYNDGKTAGYGNGWTAAYNKVSLPTSANTSTNTITIKTPGSTKDTQNSRGYYLSNNTNNQVILYTQVNGSNVTVAKYDHNKYNAGWNAAYDKVSIPTASNTSTNSMTVKGPSSSVGGQLTQTYNLSNNGDNQVILYTQVNGSNVTVAKYDHNKYTAGRNAVKINAFTADARTQGLNDHRTFTYKTDAPTPASKEETWYLSKGPWDDSDHTRSVYLRYGSATGTAYAETSINAQSVWQDGFDNGVASVPASSYKTITSSTWYYTVTSAGNGYYNHRFSVTNRSSSLSGFENEGNYYIYKQV